MKRILLTVHKFFPEHRAGTEVLTLKVAQELQHRGYQVAVLTADPLDVKVSIKDKNAQSFLYSDEELSSYEYEGINVFSLNEAARLTNNRFANEHYHPYLKKYYSQIFRSFKPDLIHCFHLQNLSTSLIEVAKEKNIPIIYSATDFWLVCPIVQLRRTDGSNCLGPSPLAMNCLTCYTPEVLPKQEEFIGALANKYPRYWWQIIQLPTLLKNAINTSAYFTYLANKIPRAIEATAERPYILKQFIRQLNAITVPTELMCKLFIKNGVDAEFIHHIPYGIDTIPLQEGQNKTASDVLRIAFIGVLSEHKGPDLLIKAFQNLPTDAKASLILYGDHRQFPEYSNKLRKLIDDSPLSKKIRLGGVFPNDQMGKVFQSIDVLVVPSRWYENTPLVIQSSFAAKTPVIATDLGGMSELVKHEFNGLLFEANSVQSLTDQLSKLLVDRNLLKKLASNIGSERTIADMVNDLEPVYANNIQIKESMKSNV